MTKPFFLLAAGLILVAGCTTTATSSGETRMAAAEDENLVCESKKVTGSIIPQRICMTKEEWEEQRQAAKDATGDVQRRSLSSCAAGGSCGAN